jgi:hypothetical protein
LNEPFTLHAALIAWISACADGSFDFVTAFPSLAITFPFSSTTMAPNGPPPV